MSEVLVLASCLTEKERDFLDRKPECCSGVITHDKYGKVFVFSNKKYDMFEKHIVTSSSSRAFALRAISRALRINPLKSHDPELCSAVILNCAISLYAVSPSDGERLIRSAKL